LYYGVAALLFGKKSKEYVLFHASLNPRPNFFYNVKDGGRTESHLFLDVVPFSNSSQKYCLNRLDQWTTLEHGKLLNKEILVTINWDLFDVESKKRVLQNIEKERLKYKKRLDSEAQKERVKAHLSRKEREALKNQRIILEKELAALKKENAEVKQQHEELKQQLLDNKKKKLFLAETKFDEILKRNNKEELKKLYDELLEFET
jgi:hypothetical protein